MNPEQIGDEDEDEDEDEDPEQISEAKSRWGREKKWEGKRKKEEKPEREKERKRKYFLNERGERYLLNFFFLVLSYSGHLSIDVRCSNGVKKKIDLASLLGHDFGV